MLNVEVDRSVAAVERDAAGVEPAIRVDRLSKIYDGVAAVEELSFQVQPGTVFGFIGPSGAGKTTTIRVLTGVTRASSGKVLVLGEDPARFSAATRARIGYMPQLSVLYPNLSLWENLNFVASLYGMPFRRKHRLMEVLELVELVDHRHKRLEEASGGMRRRLLLAATLVHGPSLLFLDEPTAGVDPMLRRKLWDHFQGLRDEGRTVFVTTQYVAEAEYCDVVAALGWGRLAALDTPAGLRRRAFGGDIVEVRLSGRDVVPLGPVRALPFVRSVRQRSPRELRLIVEEASTDVPELIEWLKDHGSSFESMEEHLPPFDDVFYELMRSQEQPIA